MATGLGKAASRFYGMPITEEILAQLPEGFADFREEDLVKAHLMHNDSDYGFGTIDTTLSGFVVLDNFVDDKGHHLLDLRDTGQVHRQDRENREISSPTFETLADYVGFNRDLRAASEREEHIFQSWTAKNKKGKESTKTVATLDLAQRYQGLGWVYAQPHFSEFVPEKDVFGSYRAEIAAYERERSFLAADVHLALYWLLRWTAYADLAKVNDVIAAAGPQQPELFTAFAGRFSRVRPTDTPEGLNPTFRERRARFMADHAIDDKEPELSRLIQCFEMDPECLGLSALVALAEHSPDERRISELERATLRMDGREIAVVFAKALIDKWRGQTESEAAVRFARLLLKENIGRDELDAFSLVGALVPDPKLVIAAADTLLREDPYHEEILELLPAALRQAGENDRAAHVEDLHRRLGEIRGLYDECLEGEKKIGDAIEQAEGLPDEKKRLLAERILHAPKIFDEKAVERSLIWIMQLSSPHRAKLILQGLMKDVAILPRLKAMRQAVPHPDGALAADLRKVISSCASGDEDEIDSEMELEGRIHERLIERLIHESLIHEGRINERLIERRINEKLSERHIHEGLIEDITEWLSEAVGATGTGSAYDALLDQLEAPGDSKIKAFIIESAFQKSKEKSYILHKLSDAQAKRAARILIKLNHEGTDSHLFHAAGHQLYRFDHKGAEDVLVEALNHEHEKDLVRHLYSAVYNMKTESSREALIERLFTETRHYWLMSSELESIFSDEVHARVLHLLHDRKNVDAANRYTSVLRKFIKKDPPLIELLEEVLTWETPDSAKLKYILLEGTRAALAQKQFALVAMAYPRAERIEGPALSDYLAIDLKTVYTDPFSDPKKRRELDSVLSGQALKTQKELDQASAARRSSGMADVAISDEALGLLARTTLAKRILHDPESGIVWFQDNNGDFFYFDGFDVVAPPFEAQMNVRRGLPEFLKPISRFTRRLSFWTQSARDYVDCAQYENRIVYQAGGVGLVVNNGEIETSLGIIARDTEDATRWMELLKKYPPPGYRESEPWYVPETGAIARSIYRNRKSEDLIMLAPRPAPDTPSPEELALEKEILDDVHRGGSLGSFEIRRNERRASDMFVIEFLGERTRVSYKDPNRYVEALGEFRDYFEKYGWQAVLPKLELAQGAGVPQNDIDQYERSRGKAFPDRLRDFWRKVGWAQWRVGEQGARVLPPGEVQERNKDVAVGEEIFIVSLSGQAIARIAETSPIEAYDRFAPLLASQFLWRLVHAVEEIAPHTRMVMYGSTYPEGIITERLETQAEPSAKFWEVLLDSGRNYVSTRDGRVGADGKVWTKHFDSLEAAKAVYEQLIAGKKKEGYRKVRA